ncbi:MAG: stage IV sporulation protein A [Oscillospiraceae bacterium]|nr:stage IV sporulation protein A [Oscillospiraceae bacterium]
MIGSEIYQELALRTGGACILGVVGPVRTGKSTFIKRFMEQMVIPGIEDAYVRQRARDELPQSGSGRSIMTSEPKFIPEDAVQLSLGEGSSLSVRLVDCVGYMVEGASGQTEDGHERMVTTPWAETELPMTVAAEQGTQIVIRDHATLGIVVTTDGTICDLPRDAYTAPEGRVIRELQEIGKPFVVLLNSTEPEGERAQTIAAQIREAYDVSVLPVDLLTLDTRAFCEILRDALQEFPFRELKIALPDWVEALENDDPLKKGLFEMLRDAAKDMTRQRDRKKLAERLAAWEERPTLRLIQDELGKGSSLIALDLPRERYFRVLSEKTGIPIGGDRDLMSVLRELSLVRGDYEQIREALEQVRSTGYGVVLPCRDALHLEEPKIVQKGGRYSVQLRASAPVIHMLMTEVETEVNPAISGGAASEEIMGFLLQGFEGDLDALWGSKIFGDPLEELAEKDLNAKLQALPDSAKRKLREALQRLINENGSGLICILL